MLFRQTGLFFSFQTSGFCSFGSRMLAMFKGFSCLDCRQPSDWSPFLSHKNAGSKVSDRDLHWSNSWWRMNNIYIHSMCFITMDSLDILGLFNLSFTIFPWDEASHFGMIVLILFRCLKQIQGIIEKGWFVYLNIWTGYRYHFVLRVWSNLSALRRPCWCYGIPPTMNGGFDTRSIFRKIWWSY